MKTLAEIQTLMKKALLDPKLDPSDLLLEHLDQNSSRSPTQQIGIYRQTVRSNLYSALEDTFSACSKVVGKDYFKQLAAEYFTKHPPEDTDLNIYGDQFPNYLQSVLETRPEAASLPYLPDLARLEWYWYILSFTDPAQRFTLESEYPIHLIWDLALGKSEEEVNLNSGGVTLDLYKENGKKLAKLV